MKFTLSWLKYHLDTSAELEEILDTLTMIGLEVEEVINPAERLKDFTIAHVVSAEQHPNADRLKVCKVNTGTEVIQVICGAPNAKTGMKGVFAKAGTYIPGTDMLLKPGVIRGEESNGMLCSERELELSDNHEGIIELDSDAPIGMKYVDYSGLNDPMIEIAITPNRPDCLAVQGIARDLAATGLGKLIDRKPTPVEKKFKSPVDIILDLDEENKMACSKFAGCYIRGVKNTESPSRMQNRLRAIGLRPINALVDVTNYLSYNSARPLHVYDADLLNGNIRARMGKEGEKFLALDGKEYEVNEKMCVIADDEDVLGLGGIIGGESTGSQIDTQNVFIESALFDPVLIAKTGRILSIDSDARYRFERGVDPNFVVDGLELAVKLITDICGGEASEIIVKGDGYDNDVIIDFNFDEVRRLSGVNVLDAEIRVYLRELGFWITGTEGEYKVSPPSWRPDITEKACIVEEVIRIHGFDKIVSKPLPQLNAIAQKILLPSQKRAQMSKRYLANRALSEVVTWSFISEEQAMLFNNNYNLVELANPISSELSFMRTSMLAQLITAAQKNADRGFSDAGLFEVGPIYWGMEPDEQHNIATAIRRDQMRFTGSGRHWQDHNSKNVDVFDAKEDAMGLLATLGVNTENLMINNDVPSWYHPGRAGRISLGPKNLLAYFGEIHPKILQKLQVKGKYAAIEVFINNIPLPKGAKSTSKKGFNISDLQPLKRDFAFIIDKNIAANDLLKAVRGADKNLIASVNIFDVYEGENIASNKKSIALEVNIQPTKQTLTEDELSELSNKIIAKVEKSTGGELRQ